MNLLSRRMDSRMVVMYSRTRITNSSLTALAAGWAFLPLRSRSALILESASWSDFSLSRNKRSCLVSWWSSTKGRWSKPDQYWSAGMDFNETVRQHCLRTYLHSCPKTDNPESRRPEVGSVQSTSSLVKN